MNTSRLGTWIVVALAVAAVVVAVGAVMGPVIDSLRKMATDSFAPPDFVRDVAAPPSPSDWTTLLSLEGAWDFRIGDAARWATDTSETGWDRVFVPAAWEDEGYFGYDGFAWYRKTFSLDADAASRAKGAPVHLLLGRIDDADEVWLNGTPLGRGGQMPPFYKTAAFSFRTYRIPPGLLRLDSPNRLAVRVYDAGLEGGILEGPVALVVPTEQNPAGVPVVADLAGDWRFTLGDDRRWADPGFDDVTWSTPHVPATWETQGFADADGYAWYRKTVRLDADDVRQDLVLVLGAVDDLDEAFVNGVRVGGTGRIDDGEVRGDEWEIERVYPVPAGTLQQGDNVIAIRVYDGLVDGGIYRGPVALMTPEAYAERQQRRGGDDW